MFRFANPEYLYLLLFIPLGTILYFYARYRQRKKMSRLGEAALIKDLMPEYSPLRKNLKICLLSSHILGHLLHVGLSGFQIRLPVRHLFFGFDVFVQLIPVITMYILDIFRLIDQICK